ncbi:MULTISPECIES: DUF6497 family protein [Halocynthiibacter]|uniref:DUF6497 family protein n=1 Tax=Halocynthiibacter halioticoli TaxID=2986804 RepID=A0AAE3IXF6_9RHOB|nr:MULTISPECIES: DUF6497 family protein [Halocynthiibacter]MCV6823779.1 DUF6497 family protein [Halocynthiibacter halioticoli]MCW4056780.1 DUF6497 family protein [Halocynthiibacter sp. SDUM655004]MDE0590202.1 DUF6497 family protein [Halocynthiibacter sp. C4]
MARVALTCGLCTRAAVTKLAVTLGGSALAEAEPLRVPSGQDVEFLQQIEAEGALGGGDPYGKSTHFRFVAPSLSREQSYDAVAEDLMFLCNRFAIPRLDEAGYQDGAEVVISVAKAPTEFGALTPDIPKFFESFSVESGICHWGDY